MCGFHNPFLAIRLAHTLVPSPREPHTLVDLFASECNLIYQFRCANEWIADESAHRLRTHLPLIFRALADGKFAFG